MIPFPAQISVKWNEMEHSVYFDASAHSTGVTEARLKTESTNSMADDLIVRFRREAATSRGSWKSDNYAKVKFQGVEMLSGSLKTDSPRSATLKLRTPFGSLKSLFAAYDVRRADAMEARLDHNAGENRAEATAALHLGGGSDGRLGGTLTVEHTFGPDLSVVIGVMRPTSSSPSESARLHALVGPRGVDVSAERDPVRGDFDVSARLLCPTRPAEFFASLERNSVRSRLGSRLTTQGREVYSIEVNRENDPALDSQMSAR